jgi:hypothetical protein
MQAFAVDRRKVGVRVGCDGVESQMHMGDLEKV